MFSCLDIPLLLTKKIKETTITTTSQPKITVDEKHVKTDLPKKVTITTATPSSSSNPAV